MMKSGDVSELSVEKEKLDQLLSLSGRVLISNSLLAALLTYMQLKVVSSWVSFMWLGAIVGINLARHFIALYCMKHPVNTSSSVSLRINIFRAGLVLVALVWALSVFFVYDADKLEHLLFVAYMMAGLSAGAAVVYSVDMFSALTFIVISVFPMLVVFLLSSHEVLIAMALAGFFYMMFLIVSISAFHKKLIEGIKLRLDAVRHADQIEQLAFYDELTGLPNRRLMLDRLERAFVQSWRTGKRAALMFLDLDHFKELNDNKGHDVGDMLLTQVGERLKDSVRVSDTVSRLGGDEFVVLLENLNEGYDEAIEEVNEVTKLIIANLNQTYHLVDIEYQITPSIGIAMLGEHGRTQQNLLKHADIAMYHAKHQGGNAACVYDDSVMQVK